MPSLINMIRAIFCCSEKKSEYAGYGYSARRQGSSRQSSTASGIPTVRSSWARHSSASTSSNKSRASGSTFGMNVQTMVNRAPKTIVNKAPKESLPQPRGLTRSLAFSVHETKPRELSTRLSGNRPPTFGPTTYSVVDSAPGRPINISRPGNDDVPRISVRMARRGKKPEKGSPISPPFHGNRGIDPTERLVPRTKSSDSFKTNKAKLGMMMQDLRDLVDAREAEEAASSPLKKAFQDFHAFWDDKKSETDYSNPIPGPSKPYRGKPSTATYEAPRYVPPPPGWAPGGITIKKW